MSVFNKIVTTAGQVFAGLLMVFLALLAGAGCVWTLNWIFEMLGV